MQRYCILLMVLIASRLQFSECHIKLNVPRVRLPYFDQFSINFTLQVESPGCYTWSVTRPDVITITTVGDANSFEYDGTECASQVVISAAPRISPCCPSSAIVYVEDRVTKEVVRCDVIIDRIVSLSIHTTTKELHMEEAPSEFYVRAHASKGDTFSTTDGVPFRWWLEPAGPDTTVEPQTIMRFMTFSESTYQAPPGVAKLEASRLQGDTMLVEGLKTGSARVFAKLTDSIYKNVQPAEVRIVVVANLQLDPREAYIVPDTRLPLRLRQVRHGKLVDIPLPSPIYSFEVSNKSVVSYESQKSIITALNYGSTDIIVRDKNALASNGGDLIEQSEGLIARITVCEPKYLALAVMPYRNWALRIGQEYEVQVDIYDEENQKIFVSDNILVETTFDSAYFKIIRSSANGTYHVGIPIKTGSAKVQAKLKFTQKLDGSLIEPRSPISVKADMEIFQSVVINPGEVVLPWDPNVQPKHDIRFTATGGNGNFFWTSGNTSVTTVMQNGVARTEAMGSAIITASMTINSYIKGTTKVYILPPTDMKILESNLEGEIGTPILVPLAFYTILPNSVAKTVVPYSRCHQLPYQVHVEDSQFTYNGTKFFTPDRPACAYLPIIGSTLGSSLVTVTYKVQDLTFKDSVVVSTFKPLAVIEPVSLRTVLAVGSSRQLVFEGGPRPFVENYGFFRSITVANQSVASTEESGSAVSKDDFYVYTVLCKEIGETSVVLEVGNRPRQSGAAGKVRRTAEVRVKCAEPAKIYYKVESSIKAGGVKCPSEASATQVIRVAIPNYDSTRVNVVVKDSDGSRFDNITSLEIQWSATPALVTFLHPHSITTETVNMGGYFTVGQARQTLQPIGKSGNVVLRAQVVGYNKDVLYKAGIKQKAKLSSLIADTDEEFDERSYAMDLQLVSDVIGYPSDISLFNHPASKVTVRIEEGSGYFDYEIIGDDIVKVEYFEGNKSLNMIPRTEGFAKILIKDLCLTPRKPAEISVQVNGIGLIDVNVQNQLQVHQETFLEVTVYDKGGNLLPPHVLSRINLKMSSVDKTVLQIAPVEPTSDDIRSSKRRYIVKGVGVGVVLVSFSADGPGKLVDSRPAKVAVFPPLSVKPKNITLLVGSVYQLKSVGGPEDDSSIIYKLRKSHEVASVTSNGILQGRTLGETAIEVAAVNINKEDQVYSQDIVNVKVVNLRGVRIRAPLARIQAGFEMPIYIVGVGENQENLDPPVLLGDKKPLLEIEWTTKNPVVATLVNVFQNRGYTPMSGDQLSMRFKATSAGTVLVKVSAWFGDQEHFDEIKIDVYNPPMLRNLPCGFANYLMAPNSELRLQTNRDPSIQVEYSLIASSTQQCDEASDGCRSKGEVVTLTRDGLIRSTGVTGQATIYIGITEEFGALHSTTVVVDVKPIRYLMANPDLPVSYMGRTSAALPKGVSFPVRITYHDSTGKKFDASGSSSKVRSNRFDLIRIESRAENLTYSVTATHEGRVCLQVLDDQAGVLSDFLVTNAAESIEPKLRMGVVTVGDIICFSCPIKSTSSRNGRWSAVPGSPVTVNSESGVAYAIAPGSARIEYSLPIIGAVSAVDLNVTPIDKLRFDIPGDVEITNGDPNHVYDILVRTSDRVSATIGTNCSEVIPVHEVPVPFTCNLQFENVDVIGSYFTVAPVLSVELQQYACRIKVLQTSAETLNLNYVHSNLVMSAHVNSELWSVSNPHQREVKAASMSIIFHPALTLHAKELVLYGNDPYYEAELKLTGLSRLLELIQIIPSDATLIRVENHYSSSRLSALLPQIGSNSASSKSDANAPETRSYSVYLQQEFFAKAELDENFRMHVTVLSPMTRQQLTVPIRVKFNAQLNAATFNKKTWSGWLANLVVQTYSWILTPLVTIITTVIIAHLIHQFLIKMRNSPRTESTAVFVTQPEQESNSTPKRLIRDYQQSTPSGSPRTPVSGVACATGDHVHTPMWQSSNSPSRPKLFSTPLEGSIRSPYVRKSTNWT